MKHENHAGATLVKPAQDTFLGGYAGCFRSPQAIPGIIACNQQWPAPELGHNQAKSNP